MFKLIGKSMINKIVNSNNSNVSGILEFNNFKFFYKILDIKSYGREARGYRVIKKYFPVPKLILNLKGENSGLLLYEYEKSIGFNRGLLVDSFAKGRRGDSRQRDAIIELYNKIFLKTIKKTNANNSKMFFEERVGARFKKNYHNDFFSKNKGLRLNFNGQAIVLEIGGIRKKIEDYFGHRNKKWSVISQCDPGDLNIGTKPIVFDYLGGGYNPVMAEFAVFFWYNIAQNNYFSPIYNRNTFKNHPTIFNKLDKVELRAGRLSHRIDSKKKIFLLNYIDRVIAPVLRKAKGYDDWYYDFKNYLAMRILCVFNVATMKKKDVLLSLAYLEIFYNREDVFTPSDLKRIIKNIYR